MSDFWPSVVCGSKLCGGALLLTSTLILACFVLTLFAEIWKEMHHR